ncbi:MAG: winged helix-turn-helix domain-containing protein [Cyanobacteria bacterium]|nr:winged helix-turn-helix domain-containing protein [Cyanobacteriota bacterium]
MLLALLERAGQTVGKDQLHRTVWPDTVVEEANLSQHIFTIRKLLGATETEPYIATVARRGYQFVAPVISRAQAPTATAAMADAPHIAARCGSKSRCPPRRRWPFDPHRRLPWQPTDRASSSSRARATRRGSTCDSWENSLQCRLPAPRARPIPSSLPTAAGWASKPIGDSAKFRATAASRWRSATSRNCAAPRGLRATISFMRPARRRACGRLPLMAARPRR